MRNLERKWLKYQQDHQWLAYKRERTRHRNMIRFNKNQVKSGLILDVEGDTKKFLEMTGTNLAMGFQYKYDRNKFVPVIYTENPLPDHECDEELANKFASFFLSKIEKIRDQFKLKPLLECDENFSVPMLKAFSVMSHDEICRLIGEMKTKSCELDPLPTRIIK